MSERGGSLPGRPPPVPGFPSNAFPIVFEGFDGLNTHVPRPSIKDTEMAECDGWCPFGPNFLRTLYGTDEPIYDISDLFPLIISHFQLGLTPTLDQVAIVFLSNGQVNQINVLTGANITVLGVGAIQAPTPRTIGFSQWGNKYIIISAAQTNGYWLWDGINAFTAGGLSPEVEITNSGKFYTGAPAMFITTTGSGVSAALTAVIANGFLTRVIVNNPGTGFLVDDFAIVQVLGGGPSHDMAAAITTISSGMAVKGVSVINGGSGYTTATVASISGVGSGASVDIVATAGVITGITVINPGLGYAPGTTIVITDTGGGSGFVGVVELEGGQINGPVVTYAGTGYVTAPTVTVVGDGEGAIVTAQLDGVGGIGGLTLVNPGFGYTKALIDFTGGNQGASVKIDLMPFGISGTAVEVAFSRVFVSNGSAAQLSSNDPPPGRVVFSAPGNPADFRPSQGAGAYLADDSFVRIGYRSLRQTNGFLYEIGDSSLNYVSGVQTSAVAATATTPASTSTVFTNANADPQIGSPWPSSVQVFARNIVFANALGVYVSYGGAVTKVSDALDGLWSVARQIRGPLTDLPSAVCDLFGVIRAYMVLLPIGPDPENILALWDGKKWFTSRQDRVVKLLATQEVDSFLVAWGSDTQRLFRILNTPSDQFTKTVRSKLWSTPGYYFTKTAMRLLGVVAGDPGFIDFTVNTEAEDSATSTVFIQSSIGLVNGAGDIVIAMNASSEEVAFIGAVNNGVFGPLPTGAQGRMLGLTIETTSENVTLMSATIIAQTFETNV